MKRINTIKTKIEKIEKLFLEVKSELEIVCKEMEQPSKKPRTQGVILPTDTELREEFERLYKQFIAGNSRAVVEFIKSKSKNYLKVFCKANNVPVDTTKVSKEGIIAEVTQWYAQRKAITKGL